MLLLHLLALLARLPEGNAVPLHPAMQSIHRAVPPEGQRNLQVADVQQEPRVERNDGAASVDVLQQEK